VARQVVQAGGSEENPGGRQVVAGVAVAVVVTSEGPLRLQELSSQRLKRLEPT